MNEKNGKEIKERLEKYLTIEEKNAFLDGMILATKQDIRELKAKHD